MAQLNGKLKDKIISIRKKILEEAAFIDAAADDPEHYDFEKSENRNRLYEKILQISNDIQKLLESSENGKIIKESIKTVILELFQSISGISVRLRMNPLLQRCFRT